MLNTKRPAKEYIKAMQAEKVYVGRIWPVLAGLQPHHDRHVR
jgi:hypothetical protein